VRVFFDELEEKVYAECWNSNIFDVYILWNFFSNKPSNRHFLEWYLPNSVQEASSFIFFHTLNFTIMATLKKNLFLQGASGMLGGQLVYRTVNGQTIVTS